MLSIEQVKPYLTSTDADVRKLAEVFFQSETVPLLHADDWWRTFDSNGRLPKNLWRHSVLFSAQSAESIRRLIDASSEVVKSTKREDLPDRSPLECLPLLTLRDFAPQILKGVHDSAERARLDKRLEYLTWPPEELWAWLEELSADYSDDAYSSFPHELEDVELALSTYPEFAIPRATKLVDDVLALPDDPGTGWMPVLALDVLGKLRHRPSIDRLIRTIEHQTGPYNDAAASQSVEALLLIGGQEVIDAVERVFERRPVSWYCTLATKLAELNSPRVEAFLTRMLLRETDDSERTFLAQALVSLCTTDPDALEAMRMMVVDDRWDTTIDDPLENLIPLAEVTGWAPPELAAWKQTVHTPERDAFLKKQFDRRITGGDPEMERKLEEMRQLFNANPKAFASALKAVVSGEDLAESAPPIKTLPPGSFVRSDPKVGRNDPCPCGSGKKYKKCCLK